MSRTLLDNIRALNGHINSLEAKESLSTEKILELENMFQMCDRLVECSQQTPKTLKHYSKLERRYKGITDP